MSPIPSWGRALIPPTAALCCGFLPAEGKRASTLPGLAFPSFLELQNILSSPSPIPGQVRLLILKLPSVKWEGKQKEMSKSGPEERFSGRSSLGDLQGCFAIAQSFQVFPVKSRQALGRCW